MERNTCTVCCKSFDNPYRRHDKNGNIIEGCVDDCHTKYLIPTTNSWNWHNSKQAKKTRMEHKKFLKSKGEI